MSTALRKIIPVLLVAAAAAVGVMASAWLTQQGTEVSTAYVYDTPRALPALQLVTAQAEPVTEQWLTGEWRLVFFGFTNCPDVCPMTLNVVRQVMAALNDERDTWRALFVSVDPARDTPAAIRTYLDFFGPYFDGLTGEADQLAAFASAASVAYAVGEADENGRYTVDHTSALMVMNPQGHIVALFTSPHMADPIVADLRALQKRAGGDRS